MGADEQREYMVGVVPITSIRPSGVNPRGDKVKEGDADRARLEDSVDERNMLVPLVLARLEGEEHDYVIIDGERRYHVAVSLGIDEVPAHIVDTATDPASIVKTMFQIHAHWQPWDAAQQCNAIEPFFDELVGEYGRGNLSKLTRGVESLLGLKGTTARDRVMFLLWPDEVKQKVYSGEHEGYWYVVEIEKEIMEPARRNFPEYFDVVDKDEVREFLFRKWEEGLVRRSTAPRRASVIARCVAAAGREGEAFEILERLWKIAEWTYEDAYDEYITVFPAAAREEQIGPRALQNEIARLSQTVSDYDASTIVRGRGRSKVEKGEFVRIVADLVGNLQDLVARLASV